MASELTGIVPADVLDSVLGVAEDVASQERLLVTVKWDALRLPCPARGRSGCLRSASSFDTLTEAPGSTARIDAFAAVVR